MDTVKVKEKDEMIMKLVHYFITEQNYTPIVVNGVKDEIWLENNNGPYRIIRINSNYIHNNEQYNFDLVKTKNIMKQIKKKTLSFSIESLNIFLDLNPELEIKKLKKLDIVSINGNDDLKNNSSLNNIFPNIKEKLIEDTTGVDLIVNVTKDINKKTEKDNKLYENTFAPKKIIVTPVIIAFCTAIFILGLIGYQDVIINYGAVYGPFIKMGEFYRLLSGTFIHADIFHLFFNMYILFLIGRQLEMYLGKIKFLTVYLYSALAGSLMSVVINNDVVSIGASGAVFGVMGALLYFGYHYRLYLGQALRRQIIPLILINLIFGFMVPGIDIAAHVGGLIGGFLITMAIGVAGKSQKKDIINGVIVATIYIGFLIYMCFFR